MQNGEQGWDTRAWLVGILGGIAGGSVTAWATYPPLAGRINAVTHHASAADWVSGIAGVVSLLVLPGIVSGLARPRTFLGGLVPLTPAVAAIDWEDYIENGPTHVASWFSLSLLIVGSSLILSSGPVSLIRYGRVRARRQHEAALAAFAAQREAASIPQEGVWPPPPDYRQ